jgi:gluconolactonase
MNRVALIGLSSLAFSAFLLAQPPAPAGRGGAGAPPPQAPVEFKIVAVDPALNSLLDVNQTLHTMDTPAVNGEGPMWREGKLWFSDQQNGPIYSVTLDGKVAVVVENGAGGTINHEWTFNQGPNALVPYKNGTVLAIRQVSRDIAVLENGKFTPIVATFEGHQLNCPNDMVFSPKGVLWFTDPPFSVPGLRGGGPVADSQMPHQSVYRWKDGKLARMIDDLEYPNGIAMSPDGKTLYVDTGRPQSRIRAYNVSDSDELSNARDLLVFPQTDETGAPIRGGVDGMKVDSQGNIWIVSPGGVNVVSAQGKVLGRIQTPLGVTNVAFGGTDMKDVFFVSRSQGKVYHLKAKVAGETPLYQKP